MMLFWVNVHGSYIIGLVLMGIYLLAGMFKYGFGRLEPEPWPKGRIYRFVVYMFITFLMTFLNPNTYKMLIYPFFTIGNKNIVDKINEWASPDFHEPVFRVFLIFVMGIIFLVAVYNGKHKVTDLLLLGVFTALSLFAVRNIALYLWACTPVAGHYLTGLTVKRENSSKQYPVINLLMVLAVVTVTAVLWPPVNKLLANETVFPVGAVKHLEENRISGNILNDYNWGGFLLWSRFPENKVFIDGRTDIYADRVYPDYLTIMQCSPGFEKVLDSYRPDLVLVKPGAPLNDYIQGSGRWRVIYWDKVSVLYQKGK